jgi:rhamnose utilization protein RhaD (predicted bifunctional aldolase and dehydrogenase)
MKSLWNDDEAAPLLDSAVALRAHTSRLLGQEPGLVLHGGGNTSVKGTVHDLFGDPVDVLYVKGSGWDLATIEEAGFAPVRMDVLTRMAELESMSDHDMVTTQRAAMLDPDAPTPSVEAVLHALIPPAWVDHTHADAVVAITNTANGEERIREIYGDRALVIPYVMPGFELALEVRDMTRGLDWSSIDCLILMNHGVFTFGDSARGSYERMIDVVSRAIDAPGLEGVAVAERAGGAARASDLESLATLRLELGRARGHPVLARLDQTAEARAFADSDTVESVAARGPLTPDHVIRTKPLPLIASGDWQAAVGGYAKAYREYFERNATPEHTQLDPAPRWVVWPGVGSVGVGDSVSAAGAVSDIARHTRGAIRWAEHLGGWQPLGEKDLFDVEYWELEQAKLRRAGVRRRFAGQVALVTGAASGIGRAVAEAFHRDGAAVVATDVDPRVCELFASDDRVGVVADITDPPQVQRCVEEATLRFGGLDMLVCNAGFFPESQSIEATTDDHWQRCLDVNLTGHLVVLRAAAPFLRLGFSPAVVFVASMLWLSGKKPALHTSMSRPPKRRTAFSTQRWT